MATVNGWKVVVKKNEFKAGDKIVFLEIDSWVPHTLAPFLSKNEPREYQGVKGEKLRTENVISLLVRDDIAAPSPAH